MGAGTNTLPTAKISDRDIPAYICSDNAPVFSVKAVRNLLNILGVKTAFFEPDSRWENGYIESFNGKPTDELLRREVFNTLDEARILIE